MLREEYLISNIKQWADRLNDLQAISVPRCIKPSDFGEVKQTELHIFADASTSAYTAVAYLRIVNEQGSVHCSFVMGKARVSPLSTMSVPRLELTASILAAKLDVLIRKELDLTNCTSTIWSDSTAVLQTLYNSYKRFPTFVANCVASLVLVRSWGPAAKHHLVTPFCASLHNQRL